jgi:hypothetical protein
LSIKNGTHNVNIIVGNTCIDEQKLKGLLTYSSYQAIANTSVVSGTGAKAFSYIEMPGGQRTVLNYLQSFGINRNSTNDATGRWLTSHSGNIAYADSPIKTIPYFTRHNRVRVIDGDGSTDHPDWAVFNFGTANGRMDFDGNRTVEPYFGGENTASGGTGGLSVSTGYVWGYDQTRGWVLLYQLDLPGTGRFNHANGGWFDAGGGGGNGSGYGKKSNFDNLPVTHLGFSVS